MGTPETALTVPAGPDHEAIGTMALTNPTALKAQLDGYTAARKLFLAWLFDALTAGTDYMLIHRKLGRRPNQRDCSNKKDRSGRRCDECGAKATLCKPGSEKICGLLRLRPSFRRDVETWEMLGSPAGTIALVCELRNTEDRIVAEGRGVRDREMDYGDVNKTIKMVQKSAQTDAVLRCAGLSEVFTLDLEDMAGGGSVDGDGPEPIATPRRVIPRTGPTECGVCGALGYHEKTGPNGEVFPDADHEYYPVPRGTWKKERKEALYDPLGARGVRGGADRVEAPQPEPAGVAADDREDGKIAGPLPGCISQAQLNMLMSLCNAKGVDDMTLKNHLGTAFGYESKWQVKTGEELNAVMAWVAEQGPVTPKPAARIVRTRR